MKKIYLFALSMLLGNILFISATTPKSSSQQSSKISQSNMATSARPNINSTLQNFNHQSIKLARSASSDPIRNLSTSRAGCIFDDNFDGANDTTSLKARGYKVYYRGTGSQGPVAIWFQGNPIVFSSFNGPNDGYVGSNFNSVVDSNNIDNWLVLPSLNLDSGDVVSFYSRSPLLSIFPDSLHVWYSAAGDSVPGAISWVLLGEFKVDTTGTWEYQSFSIPVASANGRIAIRYAVVSGGPFGHNSNYIGIDQLSVFTPSAKDGNPTIITSPASGCVLSASEPVTVIINNRGTSPISGFNISYTPDSGTTVTEIITDTISPGGSYTYTFTAHADLSNLGTHSISVNIVVPGDSNLCNDDCSVIIESFALSNPLTTAVKMGFEPNESLDAWHIQNVNGDAVNWVPNVGDQHSGTSCLLKGESFQADEDWVFTSCLDLTAGSTYTIDYWYKTLEVDFQCNLESYIGTDQDAAAMAQIISQDPLPTDVAYHHSISTFSVQSSGVYYIGFRAFTIDPLGTFGLALDDINIDDGSFIGIDENKAYYNVSVYPNPSGGIFYLNSHSSLKNVTVDVFNITGQNVFSSRTNNLNQQRIDLSEQANGIYTVRITSDNFVENHTIEINK